MVIENPSSGRFELAEQGKPAFASYRVTGPVIELWHVEVDPALRGQGTAGRLMDGLLDIIRQKGMKVRPICSYAAAYLERHPEHADLRETDG